jgi:diguanylate cyclase (GGDEF)-like protein/PAS domain S-box-containing protein
VTPPEPALPEPGGPLTEESRHAAAFAASNDAILITDAQGRTVDLNPAAERMLGRARDELLGRHPSDVVQVSRSQEAEILRRIHAGGRWSGDVPFQRSNGETGMSEALVQGIWSDGVLVGTVGINRDVSETRRMAHALVEAEERWRLTLDHAPHGIALVGLDGRILRVNAALCTMLGRDPHELADLTFRDVTHPDDVDADESLLTEVLAGRLPHYHLEKRYLHRDGRVLWGLLSVALIRTGRGAAHFVAQVEDISDRRSRTERLEQLVRGDPLTGLDNRSAFFERLDERRSDAAAGAAAGLAVGFLDLDGFKAVNDEFGHAVGDELLRLVGQRLRTALRPADTAARVGGDEFALLLTVDSVGSGLAQLAERLLTKIRQPYRLQRQVLRISGSLGLTVVPADADVGAQQLLDRADAAMYRAKKSGRNTYVIG